MTKGASVPKGMLLTAGARVKLEKVGEYSSLRLGRVPREGGIVPASFDILFIALMNRI